MKLCGRVGISARQCVKRAVRSVLDIQCLRSRAPFRKQLCLSQPLVGQHIVCLRSQTEHLTLPSGLTQTMSEAAQEIPLGVTYLAYIRIVYQTFAWMLNLAAILVVDKIRRKHNSSFRSTDFVIMNFAAADFLYTFSDAIAQIIAGGNLNNLPFSSCQVLAWITGFAPVADVMCMLLLGYVRYRIMTKTPDKPRLAYRTVVKLQILGWIVAFIYPTAFVAAGITYQAPSGFYCHQIIGRPTALAASFSTFIFCVNTFPAFAMLYFYTKAYRQVASAEKSISIHNRASRAVAKMGLCVVAVYCITVFPWTMAVLIIMIYPAFPVTVAMEAMLAFFYTCNFGINPLLYFVFQRDYRKVLFKAIRHSSGSVLSWGNSESVQKKDERKQSITAQSGFTMNRGGKITSRSMSLGLTKSQTDEGRRGGGYGGNALACQRSFTDIHQHNRNAGFTVGPPQSYDDEDDDSDNESPTNTDTSDSVAATKPRDSRTLDMDLASQIPTFAMRVGPPSAISTRFSVSAAAHTSPARYNASPRSAGTMSVGTRSAAVSPSSRSAAVSVRSAAQNV